MSKLAAKLFKVSKENTGTVSNAWHFVANDFEQTYIVYYIDNINWVHIVRSKHNKSTRYWENIIIFSFH